MKSAKWRKICYSANQMNNQNWKVSAADAGVRLDKWLAAAERMGTVAVDLDRLRHHGRGRDGQPKRPPLARRRRAQDACRTDRKSVV